MWTAASGAGTALHCAWSAPAVQKFLIEIFFFVLRSLDQNNIYGYVFNIATAQSVGVVVNENSSSETPDPIRQWAHGHMLILLKFH